MHTPAQIRKHPLHPMLVTIPIGLWVFSFICDLAYVLGGGNPNWSMVAYYTMMGGVFGALAAAVPGFIDMISLPAGLQRTAMIHMAINVGVVILYLINAWLRLSKANDLVPLGLSAFSIALIAGSAWLGGKMVYVHGVAVETPPEPASPAHPRLHL
jgi:uncharacterized membrane protein